MDEPLQTDEIEAPELSVVVPVFNEEENLRELDAEIAAAVASLKGPVELIYVDDGSSDGSLAVLRELADSTPASTSEPRRHAIALRRNYGQTAALAAGFDHARGAVIVSLDADGQNDPADIPLLLTELDRGYDVVSGWRAQRQDRALSRRFPSWAANLLISAFSGVKLHDYGCTLKAYRANLLHDVHLYGDMHRFIPVYIARIGGRIGEARVHHRARRHGRSHYGSERIFKVLLDLVLIRFMSKYFTRPMHFFGQVGLFLLALSASAFFFMLTFKYGWLQLVGIDYRASFIQTPLPALAATFLSGAISSIFFGILGEILMRIYHELRELKPYAVDQTGTPEEDRDVRNFGNRRRPGRGE
jgi:glycosyltransferase involved in cell wall biosynthesis